jgi:tRNA isopentenyl-2-thiomethyl-A-37 hydroxylase MiaE
MTEDNGTLRTFASGATRDTATNKIDPEGFLDPLVVAAFSEYMDRHRVQTDGTLRDSDNWKKGFTPAAILKSMWRHFLDLWLLHRGYAPRSADHLTLFSAKGMEAVKQEILCALWFNVQAYLREVILQRDLKE